jgi:hypothetical protein
MIVVTDHLTGARPSPNLLGVVAYLRKRRDGRVEIRESAATPAGPRARTLAVFRGALAPDVLERAAALARRPFDRAALRERARTLGVPISERRADAAARALLRDLRQGVSLDPVLVTLLRQELAPLRARPVPDELAEAAEWLGVGPERRGAALRGLLRTADRLLRERPARRERAAPRFPRFASRAASA